MKVTLPPADGECVFCHTGVTDGQCGFCAEDLCSCCTVRVDYTTICGGWGRSEYLCSETCRDAWEVRRAVRR